MTKISPQKIAGKWKSGVALDVHTLSSVYLGVNEHGHEVYDTTRSEIGELLYRLKYRGDMAAAKDIVAAVSTYLKPHLQKFDLVVPVPPSGTRPLQPCYHPREGHRHHREVACRRMRYAYPFRDGIEGCHRRRQAKGAPRRTARGRRGSDRRKEDSVV